LNADALGNLAHELRTPIQVMLGLLDILQDEYADQIGEKPRALLERMNANAFDLGQTLDNLMTFVLAKGGNPATVDEDLSIESLLADIGPTLNAANRGKGLKLCFDFKHAPVVIRGPRRVITSTIVNLALNAVKFTETGSVTISIRQAQRNEGSPVIEIQVSDTGPGLSPALLEQVSQPFAQLSEASVRRHRGIGLGLAIVRQNVAMLQGGLDLRSTPGRGATFTVRFPLRGGLVNSAVHSRRSYDPIRVRAPVPRSKPQPTRGLTR
jgi:signal transduction histidine kinase